MQSLRNLKILTATTYFITEKSTFVQFYTQTDCRDVHVRSKSGNVYATEIEKLPFIRCFAAKSIFNSC